ncbi:hypothetical protein [Leptolyngbya ohadii]|uniref:hypothetical protein n=1 Tax=Leptolyngbya ohadii TaxID=1962290 RepID=UPI000B59F2CE|nr:hypothetical protein [Leptolyngbya ohadii]
MLPAQEGTVIASQSVASQQMASQQDVSSDIPQTGNSPASDSVLFLVPVGFVLVWSIATAAFLGLPKLMGGNRHRVKAAHKLPCYQCQYFTSNPYLRCAVRPETVLTEDALECSDFQLQPEKKAGSASK